MVLDLANERSLSNFSKKLEKFSLLAPRWHVSVAWHEDVSAPSKAKAMLANSRVGTRWWVIERSGGGEQFG